ncbi:hypothetical protein F5Y16DRAFT_404459 [Xylariaceae sp. FL0255]|nr:hypothetical protein F5Y16DRAFT_404459 [Xylariaceae sp. FL0255]
MRQRAPSRMHKQGKPLTEIWLEIINGSKTKPLPCGGANCIRDTLSADEIRTNLPESETVPCLAGVGQTTVNTLANAPTFSHDAMDCQDWPFWDLTVADMQLGERITGQVAPLLKRPTAPTYTQIRCLGWPKPRHEPHAVRVAKTERLPKVLIISSFNDPLVAPVWGG